MQVNFFSPLMIIKQCLPYMIENKYGRIVNIGSIWTKLSKPGRSNYSAAKSALDSLSKSISIQSLLLTPIVDCFTSLNRTLIPLNLPYWFGTYNDTSFKLYNLFRDGNPNNSFQKFFVS